MVPKSQKHDAGSRPKLTAAHRRYSGRTGGQHSGRWHLGKWRCGTAWAPPCWSASAKAERESARPSRSALASAEEHCCSCSWNVTPRPLWVCVLTHMRTWVVFFSRRCAIRMPPVGCGSTPICLQWVGVPRHSPQHPPSFFAALSGPELQSLPAALSAGVTAAAVSTIATRPWLAECVQKCSVVLFCFVIALFLDLYSVWPAQNSSRGFSPTISFLCGG